MADWHLPRWLTAGLLIACFATVQAEAEAPATNDPALDAQVMRIASDLRCLVCQNQTVADSQSDLAIDLRNQVRDMLQGGKSEAEITNYIAARYGDFVLYRPAITPRTWLLWFGPGVLTMGGLLGLVWVLHKRNRLPVDDFDSEQNNTEI